MIPHLDICTGIDKDGKTWYGKRTIHDRKVFIIQDITPKNSLIRKTIEHEVKPGSVVQVQQ